MADDAGAATDPLAAWCLATFHVTVVLTTVLVVTHAYGVVGDLLASLDPVIGIALFVLLWATTWVTTRRALDEGLLSGEAATGTVAIEGGLWGGVDGAAFFLALAAAFLAIVLGTNWRALHLDPELLFQSVLVVSVVLIGCGVAFIVGALLGVLLAIVDTGLLLVARRVVESDG